jgi:hypothetical protein
MESATTGMRECSEKQKNPSNGTSKDRSDQSAATVFGLNLNSWAGKADALDVRKWTFSDS